MRKFELERVLSEVCLRLSVDVKDIKSASRKRCHVDARKLYCYISREMKFGTFNEIADLINKDHSSAIYYYDWVDCQKDMPYSIELREDIRIVKSKIERNPKVAIRWAWGS